MLLSIHLSVTYVYRDRRREIIGLVLHTILAREPGLGSLSEIPFKVRLAAQQEECSQQTTPNRQLLQGLLQLQRCTPPKVTGFLQESMYSD